MSFKLSHFKVKELPGHNWACSCEFCNIQMYQEFDRALEQGFQKFDISEVILRGSFKKLMDSYKELGFTFNDFNYWNFKVKRMVIK